MKKKLKKFAALILVVAMLLSSVVVGSFSAFGADDSVSQNLKNAITAYENKMNGTIYTNMKAAYTAYLNACKAYDAYYYGDRSISASEMNNLASTLTNATNAMGSWSQYTGTAIGKFADDNDRVSDADYKAVYKNLLYVRRDLSTASNSEAFYAEGQQAGKSDYTAATRLYYGDTTMLYDGKTNPQFGVGLGMWGASKPWNWDWNNLRIHYCFISSNEGLQFVDTWHGKDVRLNFQWMWLDNGGNNCKLTADTSSCCNGMNGHYMTNLMRYSGDFDTIMKTIVPKITYNIGYNNGNSTYSNQSTKATIRVLNYKLIVDTMNNKKSYLSNVSKYKEDGGLATILEGFDKATKDPNSFFTSSNNYSGCEANYTDAVGKMKTTPTQDTGDYQNLRTAIDNARATYKNGKNDSNACTWDAFKTAYDNAKNMMAAVYVYNYNEKSNASTAATTLNEKRANLKAHSPGTPVRENENPATCTAKGSYDEVTKCSNCNTELSRVNKEIDYAAHNLKKIEAKTPTCTVAGNDAYWQCTVCNKLFSDAAGTTEIAAVPTIPATNHAGTLVHHAAKAANCTEAGNIEYWECASCGQLFSDAAGTTQTTIDAVTIPATGHDAVLIRHDRVEPNCVNAGTAEYWECASCRHLFSDAAGTTEITTPAIIPATQVMIQRLRIMTG